MTTLGNSPERGGGREVSFSISVGYHSQIWESFQIPQIYIVSEPTEILKALTLQLLTYADFNRGLEGWVIEDSPAP